jgi:hypothetical protein
LGRMHHQPLTKLAKTLDILYTLSACGNFSRNSR